MAVEAEWKGGKKHEIDFDGGHVVVDADGPRSTDLVLAGLLSCSGRTFQDILAKMRIEVGSVALTVEADREAEPPKVFTEVRLHWTVDPGDAPVAKVRRALELTEAYCTVLNILRKASPVKTTCDIREGEGTA